MIIDTSKLVTKDEIIKVLKGYFESWKGVDEIIIHISKENLNSNDSCLDLHKKWGYDNKGMHKIEIFDENKKGKWKKFCCRFRYCIKTKYKVKEG